MAPPADVNSDDYYRVLGVERNAEEADIARAYKKMALKHHPDKNPKHKEKAEENFKKITEAYDVLRSPEKRKAYDQFGKQGVGAGAPGPQSSDFSTGFPGGMQGGGGMTREQADNIFKMFFGGQDPFAAFAFGPGGSSRQFQGFSMDGDDDNMQGGFMGMGPMGSFMGPQGMFMTSSGRPGSGFGVKRSRAGSSGQSRWQQSAHPGDFDRPPFFAIPIGTAVTFCGLHQSQEHNGRIGRVMGYDHSDGRYTVELEHPSGKLAVRPRNVVQMCRIQIAGLENKPELNGRGAEIIQYDVAKKRYLVVLEGPRSESVSLQLGHCILPTETRVLLQGLGNQEYNGQMAQILSVDRAAKRYTVHCQSGNQIKVKYDNVRC